MLPARIALITPNLWLTERWPARVAALERLLVRLRPDIPCVQGLQRATQTCGDRVPDMHGRVPDDAPGRTTLSTSDWICAMFVPVEHGAEHTGHLEADGQLLWAQQHIESMGRTLFVAAAHRATARHRAGSETGASPRVRQRRLRAAALGRRRGLLLGPGAAQGPPTFRCRPKATVLPGEPLATEAIDLIVGNAAARPIAASLDLG